MNSWAIYSTSSKSLATFTFRCATETAVNELLFVFTHLAYHTFLKMRDNNMK